jgi:hypothetical protein
LGGGVFGDVVLFGDDGDFLFAVLGTGSDFDFGDAVEFGGEGFGDVLFAGDADDAGDGAFISGGVAGAEGWGREQGEGGEEDEFVHGISFWVSIKEHRVRCLARLAARC